jgi:hypothetical protein
MQLQRKRKAMKTKLLILACLSAFNIILATTPKVESKPETKEVKAEISLTEEFNRLNMLAEKTEKALIYKAN